MDTAMAAIGLKPDKSPNYNGAHSGDNPRAVAENFPRRVLVVDDEALIRWSVSETLSSMGMLVDQAVDAATAVQSLSMFGPFDVVVLDLRLPDNDDLTLLSRVRTLSPQSAVILMTAFGTEEIANDALRMGASALVGKPFEMREIANLVESLAVARPH